MNYNLGSIILIFLIGYLFVMWAALFIWVWNDVRQRTDDKAFQYIAALLAGVGNIFGVAVYLVIRPAQTFQEAYFSDLEEKIILAQAREFGILNEKKLAKPTRKIRGRKPRILGR